jgi:glucose/arabinose dehydrogenase
MTRQQRSGRTLVVAAITALMVMFGAASAVRTQTPATAASPAFALTDITLPPGFRISVFASGLPGARFMAVSPEGVLLVARRRAHEVVALPDANQDGVAEPVVVLRDMPNAHSLAFKDGFLYVATTPAVRRVKWSNGAPAAEPEVFAELPSSTPAVHTSRTLGFGPDGRLYVSIGSSCDVCVEGDPRRTTIQVFNPDGSSAGPYATGLRNANGFDWEPRTGRLFAGDNAQDNSGEDFPPDEINVVEAGRHYGFPFFVGGNVPNPSPLLRDVTAPLSSAQAVPPALTLPPHVAVAGLHFYTGTQFPDAFRNSLFVALHGSTTVPKKVGYKVVRLIMQDGRPDAIEDFAGGWLKDGVVTGRPSGLTTGADGALYLSDDSQGFIYRIVHR